MAASEEQVNLPPDGVIVRNLRRASYKLNVTPVEGRVTAMTSHDTHMFLGITGKGILVFNLKNGQSVFSHQLGAGGKPATKGDLSKCRDLGVTCQDISASAKYLIYIKESSGSLSLCIHEYDLVVKGIDTITREMPLPRRAPMVVDHDLDIIAISCAAWRDTWTNTEDSSKTKDVTDAHIRTIDLTTLATISQWKATENSVSLLRRQTTEDHHMLGASDTVTGLTVYDLRSPDSDSYAVLYTVPVEEIRNFHLVGNYVAVFHKFEPNVTFWNMREQRTILCINIQDQLRQLAEEFLDDADDADEGCGLHDDHDDDHVTMVTSVASDDDFILLYGTKSGCVFGMSVNNRLKLFNIPCPHELPGPEDSGAVAVRRGIQGLRYLPKGKLAVCYETYGLSVMDFDLENPPDRPPTRSQRRQ